ncbi:MAG: PEP-CTERM sorting domain-containing protein [Gemmataceae bacterium]
MTRADIIAGPATLPFNGGANTKWGMEIHANRSVFLAGFDFFHRAIGNSGTITFKDTTTNTLLFSASYTSADGSPLHFSPNVLLTPGDNYELINTKTGGSFSDAVWSNTVPFPNVSLTNGDITATRSIYDSFTDHISWFSFKNITTAVPEPASIALLTLLGFGAAVSARRRRRAA